MQCRLVRENLSRCRSWASSSQYSLRTSPNRAKPSLLRRGLPCATLVEYILNGSAGFAAELFLRSTGAYDRRSVWAHRTDQTECLFSACVDYTHSNSRESFDPPSISV